jgi:nitroimidazol reductase NimA-like FMN-containing flavoprotein (pyridoxamine 5'-phosphate oxidase superfamily)
MPLTPDELQSFLADPRLCHFATVDGTGRPRVRPIWYLWRDGAFWFTTRLQVRNTGRDVEATGTATISIASDERPYRAVIASGRVEVIGKVEDMLRAISTRYGRREGEAWLAAALKEADRTVLTLVPEWMLSWNYGRGDYRRQNQGASMRTSVRGRS